MNSKFIFKFPMAGKNRCRFSNGWKHFFQCLETHDAIGIKHRLTTPSKVWFSGRTLRSGRILRSTSHSLLSTICLSLLLTGCAVFQPRVPLELTELPRPARPAPPAFRAVQSVVFSFYGRTMTGIGVLSLDREARTFELSCMTPMGTKLFDLRMADDQPDVLFALPFFTEKEGFAEAVARDIARVYFDPDPPQISRAFRKGETLVIESRTNDINVEYSYEGTPPELMGKRFIQGRALEAQIEYLQTFEQDGFRCIGEAKLKSKIFGYQLTIRTKELNIIHEMVTE